MNRQIYKDRKIVLLTKHKKEEVIKPILEEATGCNLILETGFDTDELGTFSMEIKRPKSQLDTARLKVEIGMNLAKTDIGIASEGSFGNHPFLPIPWNLEVVLLYDKKENFEIYGVCENSETNVNHLLTDKFDEVIKFAERIGFPEHYLIIRPDNSESKEIIKGINNYKWLEEAFNNCLSKSKLGKVFLETDMRAHANPTRMKNIKRATEDLISKLQKFCPKCGAPGFIISERVQGLPCELCGLPTEMVLKNVSKCYKCNHVEEDLYPNGDACSPQYCNYCNP